MPGLTGHLCIRLPRLTIVIPDLVGAFIYNDIGYPFKVEYLDVGHAIDDVDLKGVSPITLVALQERGNQDGQTGNHRKQRVRNLR